MEGFIWFLLITQGVIFGSFAGYVAGEKGRDGMLWFINGFLFSLIALIAICGVPRANPPSAVRTDPKINDTDEKLDISFD